MAQTKRFGRIRRRA